MRNFNRLVLALTLAFSVLVPSFSIAQNFDSGYRYDPADTSQAPWKGQDHSHDQERRQQQQLEQQRADFQRYQSEQRQRDDQQNWERQEQQRQNRRQQELGADAWKTPQQGHNFGTWPPY